MKAGGVELDFFFFPVDNDFVSASCVWVVFAQFVCWFVAGLNLHMDMDILLLLAGNLFHSVTGDNSFLFLQTANFLIHY